MLNYSINIPSAFFEEELREGYLVSTDMKKVWAVELDLLNVISELCKKYNLKWFVHAGTMLGAVRHHGFIPWDDDIDIVLPRADYDKLCAIAPSELSNPYFFQNEETDTFFARNFSRLRNSNTTAILESERMYRFPYNQGIFIDIFPYDNIPNESQDVEYFKNLTILSDVWQWRNMVHFYHSKTGKGLSKRLKYFIKHIYYKYINTAKGDYRKMLRKHHEIATMYNTVDTELVGEVIIPPLNRHIWKKEWVNEVVYMPFEMLQVPVPSHYEECLQSSFGDNWKKPIKQNTMHWGVFFDAERPYTDYLK